MSDIFQDAQEDLNEQARWGDSRASAALRKALIVVRALALRIKRLEERMDRIDPPPPR